MFAFKHLADALYFRNQFLLGSFGDNLVGFIDCKERDNKYGKDNTDQNWVKKPELKAKVLEELVHIKVLDYKFTNLSKIGSISE
jgi:hypothetical protein